jgi:hypothetical protein
MTSLKRSLAANQIIVALITLPILGISRSALTCRRPQTASSARNAPRRYRGDCPMLSYEFDSYHGQEDHAQQQPPVPPTLDVGGAVRALAIPDRHIDDLQTILGGAEQ